ncbi:MAG: hypothetical protein KA974_01105 [Saprospiraceae bacterium]|nr:hypothetical protein [Saprospiraceae bacterium]MBP7679472.1 hypothetical protein [Saprospiraceae bacterium]
MKTFILGNITFAVLLSIGCNSIRTQTSNECDKKLQTAIDKHWIILEGFGKYFPVVYKRNDLFCTEITTDFKSCLIGKKSKSDVLKLFGERGIILENMIEYQSKYDAEQKELMCLQFVFSNDTLKSINYRKCDYRPL